MKLVSICRLPLPDYKARRDWRQTWETPNIWASGDRFVIPVVIGCSCIMSLSREGNPGIRSTACKVPNPCVGSRWRREAQSITTHQLLNSEPSLSSCMTRWPGPSQVQDCRPLCPWHRGWWLGMSVDGEAVWNNRRSSESDKLRSEICLYQGGLRKWVKLPSPSLSFSHGDTGVWLCFLVK